MIPGSLTGIAQAAYVALDPGEVPDYGKQY